MRDRIDATVFYLENMMVHKKIVIWVFNGIDIHILIYTSQEVLFGPHKYPFQEVVSIRAN